MNNKTENELPILDIQLIFDQKTIEFNHTTRAFFVVLEGKLELLHESNRFILKTGDVYFMSQIAAGKGNIFAKSCVLIVSFAPEFISQHLPAYPFEFIVNSSKFTDKYYGNIIRHLMDISCQYFSDAPDYYLVMSLSYGLLHELDKNFTVMTEVNMSSTEKNSDRIRAIASYVNKNYGFNITQSDMAQHLYVSPQHCSRFFRQHFQMTFLEYLNYVRLQHALDQLQYSDLSITQIAFQNGFPNLYSFNRVFKQHKQTTPNEYRKNYIASQKTDLKFDTQNQDSDTSLQSLKHYEQLLNLPAPIMEDTQLKKIELSITDSNHAFPTWDSILNIGLISDCLMYQFHIQLLDLQSQLHFKYIRFHGILDDAVISQIPHSNNYNFQNVDTLFDYFLELNIIPFIEIGTKPKKLSYALSTIGSFIDKDEYLPYSLNLEKLRPLIKHCIHRYGTQVVENWYFEIWMDFDQYFITDQLEDTLNLYIAHYTQCLETIKALLPKAHVGGPGFNTVAPFSVLDHFLKKISSENLPIDFISAYLYPYEAGKDLSNKKREGDETIIIGSEQIIQKRIKRLVSSLQRASITSKKIFITEYHFSVSPRNHMNDSCFQAAFILKTLLENEESISAFGYYRALDISSNYRDVVAPIYGGSGLITKDSIKKPSYYAYRFLNNIKGKLLAKGNGYILTQIRENSYALLLYYYLHPDSEYLLHIKDYPLISYSDKLFPNASEMGYHITINNLYGFQYIVRHHFLNKSHGSILNEWISMNSTSQLSGADVLYLKNICVPHQSISVMEASNQSMSISVKLMPHEIRLIEITPASDI